MRQRGIVGIFILVLVLAVAAIAGGFYIGRLSLLTQKSPQEFSVEQAQEVDKKWKNGLIYFDSNGRVWSIDPETKVETALTPVIFPLDTSPPFVLSEDNGTIYFSSSGKINEVRITGDKIESLGEEPFSVYNLAIEGDNLIISGIDKTVTWDTSGEIPRVVDGVRNEEVIERLSAGKVLDTDLKTKRVLVKKVENLSEDGVEKMDKLFLYDLSGKLISEVKGFDTTGETNSGITKGKFLRNPDKVFLKIGSSSDFNEYIILDILTKEIVVLTGVPSYPGDIVFSPDRTKFLYREIIQNTQGFLEGVKYFVYNIESGKSQELFSKTPRSMPGHIIWLPK